MNELIKIPPQVVNIEESLIGALLVEPDFFSEIAGIIKTESFYSDANAIIFETIKKLASTGLSFNVMIVSNELKNSGNLDRAGGIVRVTELAANGSFNADVQFYAKLITEAFVRRQMIAVLADLSNKCYENDEDVETLIFALQKASNELETNFDCVDSGSTTKEVAKETLDEIYSDYEKAKNNQSAGINTGFAKLNQLIGGFKPATFIILAARPGIGKTSVALHFVTTAAKSGKYVNFFTFEMTKPQIFKILIAGEGNIDRTNIRDGKLDDFELKKIDRAIRYLEDLPILWNSRRMNIAQLKSAIRKNVRRGKCDMVVIDYLQLIDSTDKRMIREQQIAEISRELKGLSLEFKIPVIALSQLNRLAETEVPQLRHLRESGAIEQDADNVIFIYKEVDGEMNEQSYSLINAKARNGSTGIFEIWHNDQMTRFGNAGENHDYVDFEFISNSHFKPNYNLDDDPF